MEFKKFTEFVNEALKPYKIPTTIGFRKREDFSHGLVREFFKFFFMMGNQPEGNFKNMADMVHDRGYDLDKELQAIGDISQEIHDYLKPPNNKAPHYDLNDFNEGAAEAVFKYMDQANQLAKKVEDGAARGGAAKKSKILQGLKGILKSLENAKNLFTSNFGELKRRKVGFRLRNESIDESGAGGNLFVPGNVGAISTNTIDQETGIPPEEDDEEDDDKFNPSIINKFAASVAGKNVVYHSRTKKTPGNSISIGRRIPESTELEVGTAVEMEHTKDPKEAEKIAKDHLAEDPHYYKKLYKAGLIDEPDAIKLAKKLSEGGFGDNVVAGQPVFTQHVDKSKQGYQDSMYYDNEDHSDDCDCALCQKDNPDLVSR